jgi:hypothetical protein
VIARLPTQGTKPLALHGGRKTAEDMLRTAARVAACRPAATLVVRRAPAYLPRVAPTARRLCSSAETVNITFIEDGEEVQVQAEIGKTLLEVAHENEVDLEGKRLRSTR